MAEPIHQIDPSVILEILLGQKRASECEIYLHKIGQKQHRYGKGIISIPALGEISKVIYEKGKNSIIKSDLFSKLIGKLEDFGIEFYYPQFVAFKLIEEIKEFEREIEPMDALNLACAIETKSGVFVTLDKTLVDNKVLEKKFKIKIKYPRDT